MRIMIRFNTDKEKTDATLPPWRVIIDGVEHLAESVSIETRSWTTLDEIAPGKMKWHITCDGTPRWDEDKKACVINQ